MADQEPIRLPTIDDVKRQASGMLKDHDLTPFDLMDRVWLLELWTEMVTTTCWLDVDLRVGLRCEVSAALWRKSAQVMEEEDETKRTFGDYLVEAGIPRPDEIESEAEEEESADSNSP